MSTFSFCAALYQQMYQLGQVQEGGGRVILSSHVSDANRFYLFQSV